MRVRVLHRAEVDLFEAVRYYEHCRHGLGLEFQDEVDATLAKIGESPARFGTYEGKHLRREYRRALVERFPYVVFYQIRGEEILVVAVAHTRREPGYWEK